MAERFSASVAARHMACPASANLELAIPNWEPPVREETAAATEGTRKHELLEPIVAGTTKDIDGFARILRYIADLRATRRFKVLVEQKLTATWLKTQPGTTVDYCLYTQDEIHVIDYKWGKIPVEVVGNEQLLYYAACLAPLAPRAKGVTLHILQPYADNFESWFADTNVLAQFISDAQAAEDRIQRGVVTFGPTDHHCTFCPANPHGRGSKGRPFCPAQMQMLYPDKTDEDAILAL